jgi:hypothetical protein
MEIKEPFLKISINLGRELTVSSGYIEKLEKIADKEIGAFHDFLSKSSIGMEDNIDWWLSGYSSRNCFTSHLYLMLCSILLVRDVAQENKFFEIETDSFTLYRVFVTILKGEKSKAKVKYKLKIRNIFIKIYLLLLFPVLKLFEYCFRFLFIKRKKDLSQKLKNNRIILLSSFAKPNFFNDDNDRYFPAIKNHISPSEEQRIFFLPRQYDTRLFSRIKEINLFRKSDRNVILAEDFLNFNDYLYSFLHLIRMLGKKREVVQWYGFDVSLFYYREVLYSMSSSIEALLFYRAINGMRKKGLKILRFINFTENQTIDKALHAGIRNFFPNTINVGYEGYSPVSKYYCSFPTSLENRCGVLPDIFAFPGSSYSKWALQFCEDVSSIIVPHLRGRKIWQYSVPERMGSSELNILVVLPYFDEYLELFFSIIDQLLKDFGTKVKFEIKAHPTIECDILGKYLNYKSNCLRLVSGDIYELISKNDLMITTTSGSVVDSLAMGVPVAQIANKNSFFFNYIPGNFDTESGFVFRNYNDLSNYIFRMILARNKPDYFFQRTSQKIKSNFYQKISRKGVRELLGLNS